jgi:hypothetical protein
MRQFRLASFERALMQPPQRTGNLRLLKRLGALEDHLDQLLHDLLLWSKNVQITCDGYHMKELCIFCAGMIVGAGVIAIILGIHAINCMFWGVG